MNLKIKFICLFIFVGLFLATEKTPCNHCKQSILSSWIIHADKNYHSNCYENDIAPKCSLCFERLKGEYLIDAWGNPFHKEHEKNGIYCSSCSRIISEGVTQGGYNLNDGRFLCSLCQSNIIESIPQINTSKLKVLNLLQEIGIKGIKEEISITLGNRIFLQKTANEISSSHLKGFTEFSYLDSPFGKLVSKYEIYILDRLPAIEFEAVLAHEYLHVWLYEKNIELPPAEREGFCNLASAYIYENNGTTFSKIHLDSMDKDSHPNYGQGFRMMKFKLEQMGWKRLLHSLQQ